MKGWRVMLGNQALNWTSPLLVVFGCSCSIESVCARRGFDLDWFIKIALCLSAIYLVAAWIVFHARSSRQTLVLVILFAAIFRLSILFAAPYPSDDVYRYVWDGHAQAASINPYGLLVL